MHGMNVEKNKPDHLKANGLVNFRIKTDLKVTICWNGTPLVFVRYAQVLQRNLLPPFCTLKKVSILLGYDAASLGEQFPAFQSIIVLSSSRVWILTRHLDPWIGRDVILHIRNHSPSTVASYLWRTHSCTLQLWTSQNLYHQKLGSRLLQNMFFIIAAGRRSNPTVSTSYQVLKQEWHKSFFIHSLVFSP